MNLEYLVTLNDVGKNVDQILKDNFNISTRLRSKLLLNKCIYLNHKNVDTRFFPADGDKIFIDLNYEEESCNIVPTEMQLDILFEDDWLLIVNKPAGIPVHPSRAHYANSLSNGVKFYFDSIGLHKKIRPVNRLDLNTSGIVIFAKNEYIQECLISQMASNTFSKEYIAIVNGNINNSGIVDAPIAREENSIIKRCVSFENGQNAITKYEVLAKKEDYSIIKCYLLTGRTHQIRVHMAYIGHPLLGDTLYGLESSLIDRQALHSFCVKFIHPVTKKEINICSDIPEDMKNLE